MVSHMTLFIQEENGTVDLKVEGRFSISEEYLLT